MGCDMTVREMHRVLQKAGIPGHWKMRRSELCRQINSISKRNQSENSAGLRFPAVLSGAGVDGEELRALQTWPETPEREYPLTTDRAVIQRYLDAQCDDDLRELARLVLAHTRYVSWDDYRAAFTRNVDRLEEALRG